MTEIFATIRLIAVLVVVLLLGFGVLLALPHSKLKELVQPFVGWAIAALSVAYIASPLDVMPEIFLGPFGLVDDLAALAVGIASAVAAMKAGKGTKQLH
jgi:uncharacterized membrane protein YkvA (DUF1232 family)